jgi:hypothetical protein
LLFSLHLLFILSLYLCLYFLLPLFHYLLLLLLWHLLLLLLSYFFYKLFCLLLMTSFNHLFLNPTLLLPSLLLFLSSFSLGFLSLSLSSFLFFFHSLCFLTDNLSKLILKLPNFLFLFLYLFLNILLLNPLIPPFCFNNLNLFLLSLYFIKYLLAFISSKIQYIY